MRLSQLRTPPRDGVVLPVRSASSIASSGCSTPVQTSQKFNPAKCAIPASAPPLAVFEAPVESRAQASPQSPSAQSPGSRSARGGSAGNVPHSPRLKHSTDHAHRGDGHMCMCEICSCGMHRCAHKPHQPFDGETTNRSVHKELPLAPRNAPKQTVRTAQSRQPFDGASTYKKDYDEKPLPSGYQPVLETRKPLPFDGNSSYRQEYTEKPLSMESPSKIEPKPSQPFDGDTTYRSVHDEKPLPNRPERTNSRKTEQTKQPFDGASTYKQDFHQKPLPPSQQAVLQSYNSLPFDGNSSYRHEYTEKPLNMETPAKVDRKESQPFDGQSTYRSDHNEKALPNKPQRLRSAPPTTRKKENLDWESESRNAYTAKPLPAQGPIPTATNKSLPFDGASSYKADYTKKHVPLDPVREFPNKPQQPFAGETTYRREHDTKPLPEKSTPQRSQPTPRKENSASDWNTTSRSDYVQHKLERGSGPQQNLSRIPDNRDFGTTHRQDYVPKEAAHHCCEIHKMPPAPRHAPEGREHHFWDDRQCMWK